MTEVQQAFWTRAALQRLGCGLVLAVCALHSAAQTSTNATTAPLAAASGSWQQLSAPQKQALAPLATQWGSLTPQQQSKWLAISQNFAQLPASEKAIMHTRMTDWVALSPQQRNQARFNYNAVQSLPKEDKKAKWEAYQALSAEDKRLLSVGTAAPAKSAATISKPPETVRLVAPQARTIDSAKDITRPAASAQPLDRKTLLPKPKSAEPAQPAEAPAHSEGASS